MKVKYIFNESEFQINVSMIQKLTKFLFEIDSVGETRPISVRIYDASETLLGWYGLVQIVFTEPASTYRFKIGKMRVELINKGVRKILHNEADKNFTVVLFFASFWSNKNHLMIYQMSHE